MCEKNTIAKHQTNIKSLNFKSGKKFVFVFFILSTRSQLKFVRRQTAYWKCPALLAHINDRIMIWWKAIFNALWLMTVIMQQMCKCFARASQMALLARSRIHIPPPLCVSINSIGEKKIRATFGAIIIIYTGIFDVIYLISLKIAQKEQQQQSHTQEWERLGNTTNGRQRKSYLCAIKCIKGEKKTYAKSK